MNRGTFEQFLTRRFTSSSTPVGDLARRTAKRMNATDVPSAADMSPAVFDPEDVSRDVMRGPEVCERVVREVLDMEAGCRNSST